MQQPSERSHVMAPSRRRIDRVLDPAYTAELPGCSIDDLRARHTECLEIETEVSYVRRLCQARLDIMRAELDRRAAGGSVGDLIAALPQILADDGPRAPVAETRLPRHLAPSMEIRWTRGLERLVFDGTLANLPTVPEDELHATIEQLTEFEGQLSSQRQQLHRVIDAVEGDIAGRHKVGQA